MKQIQKLFSLLFVSVLNADQFSFQIYNDFFGFAGTDYHFTSGFAVSWIDNVFENENTTTVSSYTKLVVNTIDVIDFRNFEKPKHYNTGLSLSQIIVTPIEKSLSIPQYDDIPYAGYLALSLFLFEWDEKSFNEFRIEFGVVGRESGAKFVQNTFHNVFNGGKSEGWDTQLGTEYIANLLLRHGEISWKLHKKNSLSMDWFNHYGVQLGNFTTDIFAGSMFRIGDNYLENFNIHYPYLREEASLLQLKKKHNGFGWSFSAGISGELLAYSYILDEGKREGYETNKRAFNATVYMGIDLLYNVHKLTFFYQSQSPYTYKQDKLNKFGGFMYSYQF